MIEHSKMLSQTLLIQSAVKIIITTSGLKSRQLLNEILCIIFYFFISRFSTESPKMELLEVSCESGGRGGAFLEAGGAHRWHPKGSHSACAEYHIKEETGTMMCTNSLRDSKVNHCARLSAYRSSVLLVNVNEPGRRCVRPACVCLYVC